MITRKDLEDMGYYETFNIHTTEKVPKTPEDMLREFSIVTGQTEPNPELYLRLIQEECVEFFEADDPEEAMKELADLLYVCYGFAMHMGWDISTALRRIHENNLGRIRQPDGTIKRREDGKIMKNPMYPKPELKDLLKGNEGKT